MNNIDDLIEFLMKCAFWFLVICVILLVIERIRLTDAIIKSLAK